MIASNMDNWFILNPWLIKSLKNGTVPGKTTHVAMSRYGFNGWDPQVADGVAPDSADQRPLRCARHGPSVASLLGSHPPRAGRCGRLGNDLSINFFVI